MLAAHCRRRTKKRFLDLDKSISCAVFNLVRGTGGAGKPNLQAPTEKKPQYAECLCRSLLERSSMIGSL